MKHKCNTKTANINVQKLSSLNVVLSTTIMTPVKPQISKFKAELSRVTAVKLISVCYKRVMSFVHVSISFVCNILSVEIAQGLFGINLKYGSFVLNA